MTPKRKAAPKETGAKGWVNRAYIYGERHVATVALVALGLGVVLAGFAFYSFFNERAIERRVTHTETACTLHPAGQKCQTTKQRSDEKRSVASACVLAYKLDKNGQLLRLTKCPVEPKRQKRIESATAEHGSAVGPTASIAPVEAPKGGDAESSPEHVGSSLPGPHHGGGGGSTKVGGGGQGVKESPEKLPPSSSGSTESATAPSPTAPSSPAASSSQTTERTTETVVEAAPPAEAPAPVRSATGQLVESVGSTVEGLGETVGGTVEGVESTTCSLAKVLCHE